MRIAMVLVLVLCGLNVMAETPDLRVGPTDAGRYYWQQKDRNLLRVADISALSDYLSTKHALRSCSRCKEANPLVRAITPEGNLLFNLWLNRMAMRHITEPKTSSMFKFVIGTRFMVAALNIRVARK